MKITRTILITLAAAGAWFLPGHLAVLLLLAWVWVTSMAAAGNTAKVMSAETRVSALENVAASHSTTLTSHAALITTAQTTANTANTTANTANSTANTANNAVNNLTGAQTSTNGLPNGGINGSSGSNALSNGNIVGYSGPQIGGAAAHYHGASGDGNAYTVSDSYHVHDPGSYAVISGQHSHTV